MVDNPRLNDVEPFEEKKKLFSKISEKRSQELANLRNIIKAETLDENVLLTNNQVKYIKEEQKKLNFKLYSGEFEDELQTLNESMKSYRERLKINKKDHSKMVSKFNAEENQNNYFKKIQQTLEKLPHLSYEHVRLVLNEDDSDKLEMIDKSKANKEEID